MMLPASRKAARLHATLTQEKQSVPESYFYTVDDDFAERILQLYESDRQQQKRMHSTP